MTDKTVLIVDDDLSLCNNLEDILQDEGYEPFSAVTCADGLKLAQKQRPKVALLDLKLPDGQGTALLSDLKRLYPDCLCIIITAYADLDSAVVALEKAAYHYLQKPVHPAELLRVLAGAFETIHLRELKHQAEEALQKNEELLRDFLDNANDLIQIVEPDGRFLYINHRWLEVLGYTADEAVNLSISDIIHPDSLAHFSEIFQRILAGEVFDRIEAAFVTKDGKKIYVEGSINCRFENGKPVNTRGIFRDITEQKKLEAQLQQAQKMEAMGTLAGGIAHDFNNLLMAIQGRTSIMLMKMDSSHPDIRHMKGIEDNVDSAADLTRQLMGFARGGKYEVRPTDLNELIKKQNRMFGRTKKEITIRGKYEEDLWSVEVDRGQMEQVLLNLYVNAWQAMPGGGDLHLETENVALDETDVKPFSIEPGRYVKISVTDTGVGMDKATQEKIFEPFFTTKEVGGGTGLGLASAYGIIKNHGGFINVYSEKGHGTTFNICLPASEKEVTEEKKPAGDILRGSETVLFVDDEDLIIEVAEELLGSLGYKVLIARSGKDAIKIYEENKERINIVLLDMIMPDMSGGDTYDSLKEINPKVKVLLSSGYSINGTATEILDRGCDSFIQKPFKMKELSQRLREILDEK